jgi:hypothetical protein
VAVSAAPLPTAAVIALQRTAGNVAVTSMLTRRTLPEEPKSLVELAPAAAKDMTIETDEVSFGNLGGYFKGPRSKARDGMSVEVRFAGQMGAKADVTVEKKVREGLGSLAMGALRLDSNATKGPAVDATHLDDLDISPFGGQDGHYRFTSVVRRWGTKDGARFPVEVDVTVELLGARRPELKAWSALAMDRRSALENRFSQLGFVRAEPTLDVVVDTWTQDQWGKVLQALEYVPDGMLQTLPGIVWERGHGKLGPSGEAGHYQTRRATERRLTIFDDAFTSDDELIKTVVHELGHAVSFKPTETGHKSLASSREFQAAARADSPHAITEYGKRNWEEHYAEAYSMFIAEPDTMKLLRPHVHAWFAAQQAANPARSAA